MSCTRHCTYLDAIVKVRSTHCLFSTVSIALERQFCIIAGKSSLPVTELADIGLQDKSASTSDCANTGKILSLY